MSTGVKAASIIFAAGKGSRMTGYDGNKTLLPLIPGATPFQGDRPMLLHILEQLPNGPKALVVHHRKNEILLATENLNVSYCDQPVTNGTGGALLAARPFLESVKKGGVIITMGDVPLVGRGTYESLLDRLEDHPFVVLGFTPGDRKKYGLLDTEGPFVKRIVEWTYWHRFSPTKQEGLRVCNAGIYAARVEILRFYLDRLEDRPHAVIKEQQGRFGEIKEYFITDLVELLAEDGLKTGFVVARDEREVMGIDDPAALRAAQKLFRLLFSP
ncbi:MAG: NTP transferase domain-containing protein [Thermodesulfobacteriota bacterium]